MGKRGKQPSTEPTAKALKMRLYRTGAKAKKKTERATKYATSVAKKLKKAGWWVLVEESSSLERLRNGSLQILRH